MPARVIRSEINSSQSLSRVSLLADHFFRALLLECDDFGRFDGRPQILKAALFPLREEYTPEVIEACVEELANGDQPPLRVFHVDGRPYLALTGWEKHRGKGKRAERSKYPDPPQESSSRKRSPRIPADPRGSARGSARLTSDDARLTTLGGSAEGGVPAAPAEWALKAAESLRESVRRRCPGAPVPESLVAWARELERVNASRADVEAALDWYASKARDAQPYLPECRSGRSFREKYDKVLAARKRGGVTGSTEASGKPRRYFEAQPRVGGIENPGAAIGNLLRDALARP